LAGTRLVEALKMGIRKLVEPAIDLFSDSVPLEVFVARIAGRRWNEGISDSKEYRLSIDSGKRPLAGAHLSRCPRVGFSTQDVCARGGFRFLGSNHFDSVHPSCS